MQKALAVTLVGRDRPGIVHDVAEVIAAHEADWLDSHMANIAGQFAGIVHVGVREAHRDALESDLRALSTQGLQVTIAHGQVEASDTASKLLNLELTGLDQPGIVRDISAALEGAGVSVEALETELFDGSMSGEAMFSAQARLKVPATVTLDDLDRAMEGVSSSLMVDVHFSD